MSGDTPIYKVWTCGMLIAIKVGICDDVIAGSPRQLCIFNNVTPLALRH